MHISKEPYQPCGEDESGADNVTDVLNFLNRLNSNAPLSSSSDDADSKTDKNDIHNKKGMRGWH